DFVLAAEEVQPVIKELRAAGIEVTAVHSHMLDEQPRLIFMHFWANDDAIKLAKGIRAALDKTASAKGSCVPMALVWGKTGAPNLTTGAFFHETDHHRGTRAIGLL